MVYIPFRVIVCAKMTATAKLFQTCLELHLIEVGQQLAESLSALMPYSRPLIRLGLILDDVNMSIDFVVRCNRRVELLPEFWLCVFYQFVHLFTDTHRTLYEMLRWCRS